LRKLLSLILCYELEVGVLEQLLSSAGQGKGLGVEVTLEQVAEQVAEQCNVHLKGIALEVTPLRYVYVWHTCEPCNVPVTSRSPAHLQHPSSSSRSQSHRRA
jgi:hypothetical protein